MNVNEEKIISLLESTQRPGMENLIRYMTDESDFFNAPCSGQYHLSCRGGLAQHSINVYETMLPLAIDLDLSSVVPKESSIITSLLHDIGKSTYRGKPNYVPNILKSGKQSDDKPFTTNSERLYISHEIVSLQIISKHIELTEEEEFAILYHNGLYVATGREIQGKERPLQLLLHFADMWCSRFLEKEV